MQRLGGKFCALVCVCFFMCMIFTASTVFAAKPAKADKKKAAEATQPKANAAFDINKMSDMSDYDPATWTAPTGDTIKIAVIASFSGPSAVNGQFYWGNVTWVAHDINKRGGIFVDGKKKLLQPIKADHMGRADTCAKVAERMALQEKVHIFWGTDGSNMMKIINQVANKHKIIALNASCTSDDIQDAANFGRYSFQGSFSSDQVGRGLAYYYGQIKKKEKKFYILCQDYAFGHLFAESFKKGLKEYYPESEIVGEDYHKLFLTDFAPYLTKVKASGAEVIFTGDWVPDAANLAKQAKAMGIKLPFANIWMTDANMHHELGPDGSRGWVHVGPYHSPVPFDEDFKKFIKIYRASWLKNKVLPYNSHSYEHSYAGVGGSWMMQSYWLLSLLERAKTTDADKIVALWEGDTYRCASGNIMKMRACDHKVIQDLSAEVYGSPAEQKASFTIPPYYWYKDAAFTGTIIRLPAGKVLPFMDPNLERCKGKNGWGE